MANPLDPQTAEAKARELLDGRIASVRTVVTARQRVAELRDQLAEAERADVAAYNAALRDGWSPEELRAVGLAEPDKKARVRRRSTAAKKTTAESAPVQSSAPGQG